jgi:hypothetical protein
MSQDGIRTRSIFYSNDFNDDLYIQKLMDREMKNKSELYDVDFDSFKPTVYGMFN